MKNSLLLILLLFVSFSLYSQDNYFVSSSGNNLNNGRSTSQAFQTIQYAINQIASQAPSMNRNIVLNIQGGNYIVSATGGVTLPSNFSGFNGHQIIIKNYNNETVNILGGNPVSSWSLYNTSVYQTQLGFNLSNPNLIIENYLQSSFRQQSIDDILYSGDFFYDETNQNLFYNPYNSNINSQLIFIPQSEILFKIHGNSINNRISNIEISGLNFIGTQFSLDPLAGMISLRNAESIAIHNCRFIGSGANGISAKGYIQELNIHDNRFDQIQNHGIYFQGVNIGEENFLSPSASYVHKNNEISNNYIVSYSRGSSDASGIYIQESGNNKIHNNSIYFGRGPGINLSGDSAIVNDIGQFIYNQIVTEANLTDFLHNRENNINSNELYPSSRKISGGIHLEYSGNNNVIRDNRITMTQFNENGIYIGEHANNTDISRNIIHQIKETTSPGTGIYIGSGNIDISNNIFTLGNSSNDISINEISNSISNLSFTNNIIYSDSGENIYSINAPLNNLFTNNNQNLFYHNSNQYYVGLTSGRLNFQEWQNQYGHDLNSLTANAPLFKESKTGNFTLVTGSPGLNLGFNNLPQNSAGISVNFPFLFAKDKLEAEDADGMSGTIDNNGTSLSSRSTNEYFFFDNLQLEKRLYTIEVRYSNRAPINSSPNKSLEVRENSPIGNLLATIDLPGTGNIDKFETLETNLNTTLTQRITTVYFVFKNDNSHVKIDWLKFNDGISGSSENQDNIPPTVKFITPQSGDRLNLFSSLNIKAQASDEDGNIKTMTLFINGAFKIKVENQEILEYTWDNLSSGSYLLEVKATDDDGETVFENIAIEILNEECPLIELISPQNNQFFSSEDPIEIIVEPKQSCGQVAKIEIQLAGTTLKTFENINGSTITYDLKLSKGEWPVGAVGTDIKGNVTVVSVIVNITDDSNLILYWPMDSLAGDITYDISQNENKHNGFVSGAQLTQGKIKEALLMDGTGLVDAKNQIIFNSKNYTIAGWIKPETLKGGQFLFGQANLADVRFRSDSTLQITIGGSSFSAIYEYKPQEWHHILIKNDSSYAYLFIDGNLNKQVPRGSSGGSSSPYTFTAGGMTSHDPRSGKFIGAIDDIRVYDIALSDREIKNLYSPDGNSPPDVNILSPENGDQYIAPSELVISVFADDADGFIENVQILIDDVVEYSNDEGPYKYTWTSISAGMHQITAIATDNDGLKSQNSIIISVAMNDDLLLAHWAFDEGGGNYAHDSSGNNNHGTIKGARYEEGMTGTALYFSQNDYVQTQQGLMNGLKSFTILGWINPQTDDLTLMDLWGQSGIAELGFDLSGQIKLNTNSNNWTSTPYPWIDEGWHHIAAVGTGNNLYIFFDGNLTNSGGNSINDNYGINKMPFNIGGNVSDSTKGFFEGLIDEVYVYGKALSSEEIKSHVYSVDKILPEIKITSPRTGSRYENTGGPILFKSQVKSNGAIISKVEFFANDISIGSVSSEPYNFIWENYEANNYQIRAKAITEQEIWADDKIFILILQAETEEDPTALDEKETKEENIINQESSQDKTLTNSKESNKTKQNKSLVYTVEKKENSKEDSQTNATPAPFVLLQENKPLPGRFFVEEDPLSMDLEAETLYDQSIRENKNTDKTKTESAQESSQITNNDRGPFIDSNQHDQLISRQARNNSLKDLPWYWLIPAVILIILATFLILKSKNQKKDAP